MMCWKPPHASSHSLLSHDITVPAEQLLYTLPHSREHEMEADHIGVLLASEACYDPVSLFEAFYNFVHELYHSNSSTLF